jgi:glycosyltransferase involved in cell wall biosynthesis
VCGYCFNFSNLQEMKILVSVICCDYKKYSLKECINHIKNAGFEHILINYEGLLPLNDYGQTYLQEWEWTGDGKALRQFDQDQGARLTPICIARNMCLDYAQQGNFDWILFVDSDVMIPIDTKEKLFNAPADFKIRSGIVKGRGIHSGATYMFYPNQKLGDWQCADYFTCGFMAIHKDIFWRLRFRWGLPIKANDICSEDPLFGSDAREILKETWWGNTTLKAEHWGDLKEGQTSQF